MTASHIEGAEQTLEPIMWELHLGTARVVITPPVGSELSGFIARTSPMVGVHDELHARAMVWATESTLRESAALVTLDVLDLNADAVAAIRARAATLTGIPSGRIGVTCTHTHGGPATMPGRWIGECDDAYLAFLCRAAAGAVAMACARLEPVVFGVAHGIESTVGKNRRVLGGVIDPDVPVLRFQRRDGTVAAVLTSYACHPVTLGPDNRLATADYPGYVVHSIEAVYPGSAAHFATGCCGQINTGHTSRQSVRGQGSTWRSYGEAERLGRAVAGAAIQAAEQAARLEAALPVTPRATKPAEVRVARISVPMPLLPPPPADELQGLAESWQLDVAQLEREGAAAGDIAQRRVWLAWAAAVSAGALPCEVSAEVMVIALGEAALVLLPGESFVEFGLAIKQGAAGRHLVTLAYANGTPGYIPHRSAYSQGGYEVSEAYRYYGYPSCFAPEAGESLVAAALQLLNDFGG